MISRLWRKRTTAILTAVFTATVPMLAPMAQPAVQQPAPTAKVQLQVVSFGDSLSDAGTYAPFANKLFGGGLFTTNPATVWTQQVAAYYGDTLTPAFVGGFGQKLTPAGGLDYAQGGARVALLPGVDSAPPGTPNASFALQTSVPVTQQLASYLQQYHAFTANQLVLINGGANDLVYNFNQVESNLFDLPAALVAVEVAAVRMGELVAKVHAAGAQRIVLLNLPDFSKMPQAQSLGIPPFLIQTIVRSFNETLRLTLLTEGLLGKIVLIDAFGFMDRLVADPGSFGFKVASNGMACNRSAEVTEATRLGLSNPSYFGNALFCSPETYTSPTSPQDDMFADPVHPTTHYSALFATYVEQQIAASSIGH